MYVHHTRGPTRAVLCVERGNAGGTQGVAVATLGISKRRRDADVAVSCEAADVGVRNGGEKAIGGA